jgi:DNA-binding PadR family transcriptional regulator
VPLAHTILGVLMAAPAHGYAIKKQLAAALPDGSALNDGQLYPTLARMERNGWIRKQIVEQPRHPSRHQYRLTPAGKRQFFDWLTGEGGVAPGLEYFRRSDFLQRCAFFRYLADGELAAQVKAERDAVERSLARLEPLALQIADGDADPYRRMVVEYGIRVQRLRRRWLDELLARPAARPRRTRALASAQNS